MTAVSLVQLDEREQPAPPIFQGELAPETFAALRLCLAQERAHLQCAACKAHTAEFSAPCALLSTVAPTSEVDHVYCLALSRGERNYGVLNIYLAQGRALTENEQSLLQAMAREISLALESHRLRTRELAMLLHLQQTNW